MLEETEAKEQYQKFKEGNQQAFEKIVVEYKNGIIYFIQQYTRDFQIAEDIAQDVFVYLLEHKEKYNIKYSLKSFLYTIAKCRALNYVKKAKRLKETILLEDYPKDDELEETIFREEKREQLKKFLYQLKPKYQILIFLIDIQEFTYQEVCTITKKSLSNVKVSVHRARKELALLAKKEVNIYEE